MTITMEDWSFRLDAGYRCGYFLPGGGAAETVGHRNPVDRRARRRALTVEEHSIYGRLGAGRPVAGECGQSITVAGFPDEPLVTGNQEELLDITV